MASLTNTKIKNTYVSLLKVADNGQLDAALQDITDGAGNVTGVQLNTGGDLAASGTVSFGSLKDTGENITISKFVDAADGIGANDNDTTIPTSAAVKLYVDTNITAQDLDFATDSGTGAVDLDSQTFSILGTANEIETSGTGQTVTIGLPSSITVDVTGNLTGNVSGNVTGNLTGNVSGNVTGNVTGDLTGNVTATSVLVDGVTATTQSIGDNSTKVATTAYVDAAITAENLDIAGTTGTGSVDLDSQVLTIAGTTNEIETNASGQTITVGLPSDVTIGNNLTVTTNATVGGTFGVTGATGVDGDFDVNTNKFTVQAATGNTAVAGTLGVTGNTTVSTLDATGLASLDGGIDVDGAFTVADTTGNISTSGTLGVTGTSTLGVINASGLASLDGGIDVDGAFTVADTTGNVSTTGSITAATGTINGLLDVVGEVQATFLDINGNGEVSGSFAVDTDTLFVDSTNNRVGVGTLSPASALHINSTENVRITGIASSSSTALYIPTGGILGDNGSDFFEIRNGGDASSEMRVSSRGFVSIYTGGAGGLGTGSEQMRITSAGNVLISDSTYAGFGELQIGNTSTAATRLQMISSPTVGSGGIHFGDTTSATNGRFAGFLLYDHNGDYMRLGTAETERMRIDSSGNVGIGTSPSYKLDLQILSNGTYAGNADDAIGLNIFNTSNTDGTFSAIRLGSQGSGSAGIAALYGVQTANAAGSADLAIVTRSAGTFAERVRVTANGLTFNGDTAAANALDDYEEGTWTMGVSFGGGTTGITYVRNAGTYTKIGRQVNVRGFLTLSNKGSSSGVALITNLPFTAASGDSFYGGVTIGYAENITFANQILATIQPGTTTINLRESTEAGAAEDIVDSNFANNSAIIFDVTYFV